MALIKFKSKDTNTLPEVEQYYTAERRDRAGLAWILALVSILIVALLIVALFFGGRLLYRTVTDKNDQPQQVTTSDNGSTSTVDGGSTSTDKDSTSDTSGSSNGSTSGSTGSTNS